MIHMASDGFADQFRAKFEKKFMSKRFKLLLGEIKDKDSAEQEDTPQDP